MKMDRNEIFGNLAIVFHGYQAVEGSLVEFDCECVCVCDDMCDISLLPIESIL